MAPPREEHNAGGPACAVDPTVRLVTLSQERDALSRERAALSRERAALVAQHDELAQLHQAALAEQARLQKALALAEHHIEEYRKLHDLTVMELERLRRHVFGRKSERVDPNQRQLIFDVLRKELDAVRDPAAEKRALEEEKEREAKARGKTKTRGPRQKDKLDLEHLPVERIVIPDPRVLADPDAWVRISEAVSTKLEFRRASFVRLEVVRTIWARRDAVAEVAASVLAAEVSPVPTTAAHASSSVNAATTDAPATPAPPVAPAFVTAPVPKAVAPDGSPIDSAATRMETTVVPRVIIAPLPEHPIARCLAGPALLAHMLVSRFADHLPYNRLAKRFAREGVALADSTMCG